MKQWITETQFNELTSKQKEKWFRWCWDKGYTLEKQYPHMKSYSKFPEDPKTILNFPSIGEMIEFLGEKIGFAIPDHAGNAIVWPFDKELCDVLWNNVKEVL